MQNISTNHEYYHNQHEFYHFTIHCQDIATKLSATFLHNIGSKGIHLSKTLRFQLKYAPEYQGWILKCWEQQNGQMAHKLLLVLFVLNPSNSAFAILEHISIKTHNVIDEWIHFEQLLYKNVTHNFNGMSWNNGWYHGTHANCNNIH